MRSSLVSAAGALTVVLAASLASADETPDSVRAAALLTEGRGLMAAEDYAAACPKLAESQALDPAPDTAFDLGICYQKASQAAFKAAHDLARPPEGNAGASAPSLALAPEADTQKPGHTQRVAGLVIGGAGVAGLVAGVVTAVMSKSAMDNLSAECPGRVCPSFAQRQIASAHNLASAADISLIGGAVALGAGAIVFFTAPTSKTVVGMGPATEGAGLSVAGRF
jgi:hypothetical protein